VVAALFAAIPSPADNTLHVGPLDVRFYGLAIVVGIVAGVALARRRWAERGGNPDDISGIALWAVPAGLVGARLYHVATDWPRFVGNWGDVVAVWKGGLGIPGGILGGVLVGVLVARRRRLPTLDLMDVVAPALPLAQAIGRLGNWFNQELFGRPTSLPWGLRIDAAHRPVGYEGNALFHPTFLYEALWNLALMALLLWFDRRRRLGRGELFVLYVLGYFLGRLWVEALRIDEASRVLGLRVNILVSAVAVIVAGSVFVLLRRRRSPDRGPGPRYVLEPD